MSEPQVYKNLIGGEWVASRDGNTYRQRQPGRYSEM